MFEIRGRGAPAGYNINKIMQVNSKFFIFCIWKLFCPLKLIIPKFAKVSLFGN